MIAHVVHAAAARRNDVVVPGEVLDEQRFSGSGVFLATAIAHRLSTAGLFERKVNITTKTLEKLECCDADIRKKGVDETWNEQGDFHGVSGDGDEFQWDDATANTAVVRRSDVAA
jgi:hypothetical protein